MEADTQATTPLDTKETLVNVLAQVDVAGSFEDMLTTVLEFIPKLIGFLLILVIGWIIAKVLAKIIGTVLERVGFDKAVERGGVKKAMAKTKYDASDILAKLVFYMVMLFVLQLAFGVFPANPITELITGIIAFLPNIFVAIVILVVAAAIAAAVREIVEASLGGLSYGSALANGASIAIIAIGFFAALDQLRIAPDIVNGLFYALLALVVGSAIIAIGGGGIAPMRDQWNKALDKASEEAPKVREEAEGSKEDIQQRAEERKQQAQTSSDGNDRTDERGPARPGAARR